MDDVRHRRGRAEVEEALELLGAHRISAPALRQVQVEGVDVVGRDPLHHGLEARQPEGPGRQVDHRPRPVRTEGPLVDVAHEWLRRRAARTGGTLDAGDAADQRAHLGVARLGLGRHLRQQHVLWVTDQRLVGLRAPPRVAVRIELRRLPRGEDVELRVPVQVEKPGQDDPVGLEHPHVGRLALGDARDLAARHRDVAAAPGAVRRDHRAVQRERRGRQRTAPSRGRRQLLGDAAGVCRVERPLLG